VDDSTPLLGDTGCCELMRITETLRKEKEGLRKENPWAEISTPKQTLEIILYIETDYNHTPYFYKRQARMSIIMKKW
jgi:hypothetical protein